MITEVNYQIGAGDRIFTSRSWWVADEFEPRSLYLRFSRPFNEWETEDSDQVFYGFLLDYARLFSYFWMYSPEFWPL